MSYDPQQEFLMIESRIKRGCCIKCGDAIAKGNVCDFCSCVESASVELFCLSQSDDRDRWAKEAQRKVEFWRMHRLLTLDNLEKWAGENGARILCATVRRIRAAALSLGQSPDAVFHKAAGKQDAFAEAMRETSKETALEAMAGQFIPNRQQPAA